MRILPARRLVRRVRGQAQRAMAATGIDARPGSLMLVTGGGDWVIKQIAGALGSHLREWYSDIEILDLLGRRPYLSEANVHCLCRPAFFNAEGIPPVHRSNRVVVSWLHGGKRSAHPELRAACEQLERHWRVVKRFIVPNSLTREDVLECGVDPAVVHVIPNGVDTSRFQPATESARHERRRELNIPQDAFVVGSFQRDEDDAGRPKPVKGPDILFQTLARVRRSHSVFALLAGPSRRYVEAELQARGVPYRYCRGEDDAAMLGLYHAIDAYLITSREEGGPTTLRESLACGVPVVSTRMGLAVDLIQHGVNGLLADVEDVEGLADNLLRLIDDAPLRARLAEDGLRTVRALDFRVIARRCHDEVYRLAFA